MNAQRSQAVARPGSPCGLPGGSEDTKSIASPANINPLLRRPTAAPKASDDAFPAADCTPTAWRSQCEAADDEPSPSGSCCLRPADGVVVVFAPRPLCSILATLPSICCTFFRRHYSYASLHLLRCHSFVLRCSASPSAPVRRPRLSLHRPTALRPPLSVLRPPTAVKPLDLPWAPAGVLVHRCLQSTASSSVLRRHARATLPLLRPQSLSVSPIRPVLCTPPPSLQLASIQNSITTASSWPSSFRLHCTATMARSRRSDRDASNSGSDTSASTSPERNRDDDNDSFMLQANDSLSSIAVSEAPAVDHAALLEERMRVSPISRLPPELMLNIFSKVASPADLRNCMLVSRDWARNSVGTLWHRPQTTKWRSLRSVIKTVRLTDGYFDYSNLVKRLNLAALGSEVSDGTLEPLKECKRVERLTLTNCHHLSDLSLMAMLKDNRSLLALDISGLHHVTDMTMLTLANNCVALQGLNITNCKQISDESLEAVAQHCRLLRRVSTGAAPGQAKC